MFLYLSSIVSVISMTLFSLFVLLSLLAKADGNGNRIVGGTRSLPHEFPWQAWLEEGRRFCGGSVVSPSHILTAAHCVEEAKE